MDPEVKRYFLKILNSFTMGMLWMLALSTAGFYFKLALYEDSMHWYNILFYCFSVVSLCGLLWYYYKLWSGSTQPHQEL